ncbi:MAG: ribosomal RNA small subunit methyltransferase A [Candidatus Komeilibacteria bacterium]|nr:ribosomal RNA small subunit methyltransferase A [Candidatus Komeilibacteria bacterium]
MSRESVLFLLKKFGIKPDPMVSQNFLISDTALNAVIAASDLAPADRVLEIGAGIGTLTAELVARCHTVLAVEQDTRFTKLLESLRSVNTNLRVLYRDIIAVHFEEIARELDLGIGRSYKVVANIPYHITSRIISRLIAYPMIPERIVLLVQKEVGERIVAKPGDHSKLSLSVQFYGTPELLQTVPRSAFYPAPEVDSAILRIRGIRPWQYPESEKRVWQLIALGFSAKRKKLVNNLAAGLAGEKSEIASVLEHCTIPVDSRAQGLSPDDWRSLARALP